MGCCTNSSKQYNLTVASLNYSGILTSPYEYFEKEDKHQKLINKTFREYTLKKFPDFLKTEQPLFTWNMGSIDTKWKDRYAVINLEDAGVKKDGTMMNQQQFSIQWEEVRQQTIKSLKKSYFNEKILKPGQDLKTIIDNQVGRCKQFDLLCYQTLLNVYCGVADFTKMGVVDAKSYIEGRKKEFAKPFLSESNKLSNTISSINANNHDLIFFQQTNKTLIEGLRNEVTDYHVLTRQVSNSVILVKKSLCQKDINFEESNKLFLQKYQFELKRKQNVDVSTLALQKILNFNNDSIFQGFQKFILINVHLSSKKEFNPDQIRQFCSQVCRILRVLPQYYLICGGDFNAKINTQNFTTVSTKENLKQLMNLDICPMKNQKSQEILTVKKKRTLMQPQRHKAEILDLEAKDFFVSNLEMVKKEVILISGKSILKNKQLPLLPNSEHPYDHYMILVELCTRKRGRKEEKMIKNTQDYTKNKQNIY